VVPHKIERSTIIIAPRCMRWPNSLPLRGSITAADPVDPFLAAHIDTEVQSFARLYPSLRRAN